jgi:hypothetical protein
MPDGSLASLELVHARSDQHDPVTVETCADQTVPFSSRNASISASPNASTKNANAAGKILLAATSGPDRHFGDGLGDASVACYGTLGREQNAGTSAIFEIPGGCSLCPRHSPDG